MQTRHYDKKDGLRIWMSREERAALLSYYDDDPRRKLALQLGLTGLRTDEIVEVRAEHFRSVGDTQAKLIVPDGKTGRRETPVGSDVRDISHVLSKAAELGDDQPLIDVSTRTVRNWIESAREYLADEFADDRWHRLGMHDLRRTWATDTFYSLAFEGVPIAEELTMGWGGWTMTATGRETFRTNYLGPEPDHITLRAVSMIED